MGVQDELIAHVSKREKRETILRSPENRASPPETHGSKFLNSLCRAQQLLDHPLVNTRFTPESAGAVEASILQGGANLTHRSDPRFDTADFADTAPGNLHVDYVLPRKNLQLVVGGVFWPLQADPLFRLTGVFDFAQWGPVGGFPTSDHRSVFIDVNLPAVQ